MNQGYQKQIHHDEKIQQIERGEGIIRHQKYIGLGNQGATCYLNSAIQTLYMTPEFRKNIYGWTYNEEVHGEKSTSIPYQLQKLFAELQMSQKDYIDTHGLTNSFGWTSAHGF